MAQIIASTYEIVQEIGSGGGGIVYLGRHLRLGKWVVLKADRRTLAARPEVLRREVDAMKNLSHTYIPQVYDFVEEDGVVYTVMGESGQTPETWGAICPSPGGGVGLPAARGPVLSSQPAAPWNPPRGHQAGQCYAHPGERYPAH